MQAKYRLVTRFVCCALLSMFCVAGFSSDARSDAARSDAARQMQSVPQAATTQEQSTTYTLDLIYDPVTEPTPVVRVRVNNNGPTYLFDVDTGAATPFLIAPWAAKAMGLDKLGKRTREKPGSYDGDIIDFANKITMSLIDADGDAIWNMGTPFVRIASQTDWENHPLNRSGHAGIVGIAAFANATMQFDFERKKLFLLHPAPMSLPHSSSALVFPLKPNVLDPVRWNAQMTLGSPMNKPASLLVDTGATDNAFPQEFMPRLKPTLGPTFTGYGASGVEYHSYGVLPSVLINGQEERSITAMWVKAGERRPATLGMSFLSRFRVTLDQKNAILVLERASDHDALAKVLPGDTGIRLRKNGSAFYVDEASPLLTIPGILLKPGDEIVNIDGKPTVNLSIDAATRLLNWNAGTDAKLTIKRGDKTTTVNVKRQNLFTPPAAK